MTGYFEFIAVSLRLLCVASFVWNSIDLQMWGKETGEGWLDSGSPWYDTYKTADGKYMAVGAIEPQFYESLIEGWPNN